MPRPVPLVERLIRRSPPLQELASVLRDDDAVLSPKGERPCHPDTVWLELTHKPSGSSAVLLESGEASIPSVVGWYISGSNDLILQYGRQPTAGRSRDLGNIHEYIDVEVDPSTVQERFQPNDLRDTWISKWMDRKNGQLTSLLCAKCFNSLPMICVNTCSCRISVRCGTSSSHHGPVGIL